MFPTLMDFKLDNHFLFSSAPNKEVTIVSTITNPFIINISCTFIVNIFYSLTTRNANYLLHFISQHSYLYILNVLYSVPY